MEIPHFQPILQAKITIPARLSSMVERSRLTEQLHLAQATRRLSLLSAPAGFGKTAAVVEWLHSTPFAARVAWFSIDEADNEPSRFWNYLLRALEAGLAVTDSRLARLAALPQEAFLTGLINELAGLKESLVVVLDDYHNINSPQIHRAISFLLDHQPPKMHLVITTRHEPPLPLARLRTRRQVTELTMADLRFSLDEATTLVNAATGRNLPTQQVARLEVVTEGWAAALHLTTLLLQNGRDFEAFVQSLDGNQRFMLDYLGEEVFRLQPESIQNFLLQTAALESFNAELAEELTGCEDGQAMLDRLMAANLFLLPLENRPGWYRYHSLFRQFLYSRAAQTQADHLPLLHRWAAHWYEAHDEPVQAIEHALKGGEFEYAADLIDRTTEQMYANSELKTLGRWLAALPREVVYRHLHTSLNFAWVLILTERPKQAGPYLETAAGLLEKARTEKSLLEARLESLRGEFIAAQACIERKKGNYSEAIRLSEQSLRLISETQTFLRCTITANQGHAYAALDDFNAAARCYLQTEKMGREANNSYYGLQGIVLQALLYLQFGRLHLALATAQRALPLTTLHNLAIRSAVYFVQGSVWREWNELEKAAESLRESIELAEISGAITGIYALIELARVRQAQNNSQEALALLQKVQRLAYKVDNTLTLNEIERVSVRIWLAQGNLGAVEAWLERTALDETVVPAYLQEITKLLTAHLQLAQGRVAPALEAARQVAEVAQGSGHVNLQVESLVLVAAAQARQQQPDAALDTLVRAITIAEPHGFVRRILEGDAALAGLLAKLPADHPAISKEFLAKLRPTAPVAAAPPPAAYPAVQSAAQPLRQSLPEPLTDREREVLHLLVSTTLSSQEIADHLVVAVSTIRSHIKSIYGKLDVQNRLGAIARARELALVA